MTTEKNQSGQRLREIVKNDPDKKSVGLYDMAEILVTKFNAAVVGTNYHGMFDSQSMYDLLSTNFGPAMLNRLIKSDMGQGIMVGYIIGIIEIERIAEVEDEEDGV